jgi:cell division protein FtsN
MVAVLAKPPPPAKPEAGEAPAPRVAWTTAEGGTVSGRVADDPPPGVGQRASAVLVTPMTYAIQTGAFKVAANAERQSADLRRLGFEPRTTGHVGSHGVPLTVVYAGRYPTRADAESNARTLQKAGIQTYVTALAD